jgi:hypothetical protein
MNIFELGSYLRFTSKRARFCFQQKNIHNFLQHSTVHCDVKNCQQYWKTDQLKFPKH